MNTANDLSRMVPGLDFLQNLLKGAAIPGVQGFGQWVAPTLDPEEIEKRISELKTVQFWLEQNARLLGTTIQALEVQRMTLATLQTMNLPMADLRDALKARPPAATAPAPAPSPAPAPEPAPESAPQPAGTAPAPPAVDPMQWWGALTQQFTELATQALKDGSAAAATAAAAVKAGPPAPPAAGAAAGHAAKGAVKTAAAGSTAAKTSSKAGKASKSTGRAQPARAAPRRKPAA